MAIIALVGLPIFSWIFFPILYIIVHESIDHLTLSNAYNIRKIRIDDFDNFEPDVTANSFHPITEDGLLRYPPVKESVEYFEGERDADPDMRVYCDRGACITSFAIKRTEAAEFMQTFEFGQSSSLFEYNQNYYMISRVVPFDPPSYYFDGYVYGFWMIIIGIPVIVVVWIFHRNVKGSERMANPRSP